jgi:hypothetical protein
MIFLSKAKTKKPKHHFQFADSDKCDFFLLGFQKFLGLHIIPFCISDNLKLNNLVILLSGKIMLYYDAYHIKQFCWPQIL